MSHNTHILRLLATAILLMGCERENVDDSHLYHVIHGSIGSQTRVSLENDPEDPLSYHSVWQGFEHIDVFYKYDGTYFDDPPRVPIESITADGRGATFRYEVPREWQKSGADQYDVKCFISISKATVAEDGSLYYNASLHREAMDSYVFTVYCEGTVINGVLNANFHHYYTYELLHISNTSDSDIEFSLLGFDGTLWYKEKGSLCIDDGSFVVDAPSTKQPVRESGPIIVKPGESKIVVSAYIPNGNTINEARMVTKINGEYVYSSNRLSSEVSLKQGHAYHMYAVWDGTDLKFMSSGWNPGSSEVDAGGSGYVTDGNGDVIGSGLGYGTDSNGNIVGGGSGYGADGSGNVSSGGSGYGSDGSGNLSGGGSGYTNAN